MWFSSYGNTMNPKNFEEPSERSRVSATTSPMLSVREWG